MKKQPRLMGLTQMQRFLEPHMAQMHENMFMNEELAILHGDPRLFRLVMSQHPPFVINDYRMGLLIKGEIRVSFNLVEKRISGGTLVFIGPGSIISPVSFTDDLEVYGLALSPEFPMPFAAGQMPSAFNGQVRDFQLQVSAVDLSVAQSVIDTIWQIVCQCDYNRPTVSALVAALMQHYDGLFRRQQSQQQDSLSHQQTVFDRFIYLVDHNATREHQLSFYAQRMCLTERYLGTLIRQASGITAKEWIDRALILRIKVELRHTDKSVAQIADEMNFPNPSFFCKYFKRMTGMTTQAYREK